MNTTIIRRYNGSTQCIDRVHYNVLIPNTKLIKQQQAWTVKGSADWNVPVLLSGYIYIQFFNSDSDHND